MEEDDSLESLDRIVRLESLSRSEGARTDGRHDVFDTTENLTSTDSQLHTVQFNESTPVISNYANISRIPKTVMMPTAGIKVIIKWPNISLVDIETFPYRNIFSLIIRLVGTIQNRLFCLVVHLHFVSTNSPSSGRNSLPATMLNYRLARVFCVLVFRWIIPRGMKTIHCMTIQNMVSELAHGTTIMEATSITTKFSSTVLLSFHPFHNTSNKLDFLIQ